jgi:multicomponent Na+:H+ antiporter subunit D
VYQTNRSFAYSALQGVPPEAIALICLGLLTKGGVFVSGLWLPMTHSEAETPVSALLSGVVVKTGVFPLVRFALWVPDLEPVLQLFSIGTAVLGITGAILATDTKRLLAFSTISQMGFVLSAPAMAGFYALTHGLAKASLFLTVSKLPSRQFQDLQTTSLNWPIWLAIAIPSLSITGLPLLAGFEAKTLTLKALPFWPGLLLSLAVIGTAIVFARLLFLPLHQTRHQVGDRAQPSGEPGFWLAILILCSGLVLSNQFGAETYQLQYLAKALITIAIGWGFHILIRERNLLSFPGIVERLEHLAGGMSFVLILIFWLVIA